MLIAGRRGWGAIGGMALWKRGKSGELGVLSRTYFDLFRHTSRTLACQI